MNEWNRHSCLYALLFGGLPLDDRHVAIYRQIRQPLNFSARRRPLDFEPVDLLVSAQAKKFARIMRGEITPPIILELGPLHAAGRPGNAGADGVAIASCAFQLNAEP